MSDTGTPANVPFAKVVRNDDGTFDWEHFDYYGKRTKKGGKKHGQKQAAADEVAREYPDVAIVIVPPE